MSALERPTRGPFAQDSYPLSLVAIVCGVSSSKIALMARTGRMPEATKTDNRWLVPVTAIPRVARRFGWTIGLEWMDELPALAASEVAAQAVCEMNTVAAENKRLWEVQRDLMRSVSKLNETISHQIGVSRDSKERHERDQLHRHHRIAEARRELVAQHDVERMLYNAPPTIDLSPRWWRAAKLIGQAVAIVGGMDEPTPHIPTPDLDLINFVCDRGCKKCIEEIRIQQDDPSAVPYPSDHFIAIATHPMFEV